MISNWMWYLQRNDVNKRNEWSNRTNWPYSTIPYDITPSPEFSKTMTSFVFKDPITNEFKKVGPRYNLYGTSTNIYYTGDYNAANQKNILETMGIVLDGEYRENLMTRGIYDYIEKYTRTAGCAPEGLYCYNFCLNTDPLETQPSGAINLSRFRNIELEMTTYTPSIDSNASSQYNFICDVDGNFVGVQKQNWRLYEYTYNMTLFEERYNILSFIGGNCSMMYSR